MADEQVFYTKPTTPPPVGLATSEGGYAPTDEEKKLSSLVEKRLKESKDYFKSFRKNRLDQFYKNFRCYGGDRLAKLKEIGGENWMSNMFVPMTASHIRTIHPRVVDAKPELRVEGRTTEDIKKAIYVQAFLDYVWEKAGMDSKIKDFVWQALVYGTTVGKVFWRKDMIVKTDTVIDEESLTEKDIEEKDEIYNDPDFEVVDLYNFYPDPYATSIDNARYVCQRYLMTREQIMSTYSNLKAENMQYIKTVGGDTENYAMVRLDALAVSKTDSSGVSMITSATQPSLESQLLEVVEYWERNRFVLYVNGVVLRSGPNPLGIGFVPYVVVNYEKLPFEFYGIGISEQLEQPQTTLNIIRNQRVDNVTLGIQKMFIANPYALISQKDLVARPYGLIRTTDVNGIVPVKNEPVGESAYTEDALTLDAGRMATGIDDWSRGGQGPASTTATAVTTQKESTLERIKLFIKTLESDCYSKILRYWVSMASRLYQFEELDRITDNGVDIENVKAINRPVRIQVKKQGVIRTFVSKDDLLGMFDFKALSLSTLAATKELKIQRILDIMDKAVIAGKDPTTNEMIPNLRELWKRLFYTLDWDPQQMMNPEGTAQVMPPPGEGGGMTPGNVLSANGEAATVTPSAREMLNNIAQTMGTSAPAAPNERATPTPESANMLQKVMQTNR